MKTTHLYWLAICALTTTAVIFSTGLAQQGPAAGSAGADVVAVCDVVLLFKEYDKAENQLADLKKRQREIEQEKTRREGDVRRIEEFMRNLEPGTEGYEEQYELLQNERIKLELFVRSATGKAMREHQTATRDIYNEILDAIETIAKSKGASIVMFSSGPEGLQEGTPQEMLMQIQNKRILYAAPGSDLTTEVLTLLNRQYKAQGN
ncbi:MAG: OmpH family outer membrane protein [Phycisphaerae bacterium]